MSNLVFTTLCRFDIVLKNVLFHPVSTDRSPSSCSASTLKFSIKISKDQRNEICKTLRAAVDAHGNERAYSLGPCTFRAELIILVAHEMPVVFWVALQSAFRGARTRAECDETIAPISIRDDSSLRHGGRT
jgi:hypothetical protein